MLPKSRKNDYADTKGPVRYLDASGLARPIDIPRNQRPVMAAFVAAAVLIGGYLLFSTLGAIQSSADRAQASVEENLARDVSYDLPALTSLLSLDNDAIKTTLSEAGYGIIDRSDPDGDGSSLELVKLPSDVSEAEALLLYSNGMASLSAADAALLLKGSWTLDVNRDELLEMRVGYADFASGSLNAAIDNAIETEGFDPTTIGEDGTGVDEVGNTFKTGTVDVNGTTCTWKVSAIPLSDMYGISDLPDSAVYVGVRLTV